MMDSRTKGVISVLILLVYCEHTESKGLCEFTAMFPSQGIHNCFKNSDKGFPTKDTTTLKEITETTSIQFTSDGGAKTQTIDSTSLSSLSGFPTKDTTNLKEITKATSTQLMSDGGDKTETIDSSSPSILSGFLKDTTTLKEITETTSIQLKSDGGDKTETSDSSSPSSLSDSFTTVCPPNMEYGNCTCQPSCEDPDGTKCLTACSEENICLCREGFLEKGDDCVPIEECSCFVEGQVIPNNQAYVNASCTLLCQCQSNVLTCDLTYVCNSDATCAVRDGVRQCYCNDGYTGDGQNCEVVTDCADVYNAGITDSGVYIIKPRNWPGSPFEVYCNMTDGGGWTVFQRRVDGSENFYLGWDSYKEGFGSPDHELWLGNDKIYYLTNQKNYQLRIDLVNMAGTPFYAEYDLFRINDESDDYRLDRLGKYKGNTGYDAMHYHKNRPFSTSDRDNDGWDDYNCAERQAGAWWYGEFDFYSKSECSTDPLYCEHWQEGTNSCGRCSHANLNGDYYGSARGTNLYWANIHGYECDIRFTDMKIKPVQYPLPKISDH